MHIGAPGVEGLDAVIHPEPIQHGAGGLRQLGMVAPLRLQLDDEGRFPLKQGQHLLQKGDLLLRPLQTVLLQLLRRQVLHQNVRPGGALETGVVDHRQAAVLHQMDVQLSTVAVFNGTAEGRHGVFRNMGLVVVAPVGVAILPQQLPAGMLPAAAQHQQKQFRQNVDV